jgi:hypothetical protein
MNAVWELQEDCSEQCVADAVREPLMLPCEFVSLGLLSITISEAFAEKPESPATSTSASLWANYSIDLP